jgi:N-acetylmuramoyl-L-alanine amidase
LANRENHRVLLGRWLLCAAALLCAQVIDPSAAQTPPAAATASPAGASNFPVASDARLAGDARQTRFVLDLDKPIQFRAFTLADPYRVVLDLPQVDFQLSPGSGGTGRGLIKAFRYGLVMPGGSRIVFDLTGPAKIAKSYVLDAANGQPPRLVLEFEGVDRTTFVQLLSRESRPDLRPAIEANAAAAKT